MRTLAALDSPTSSLVVSRDGSTLFTAHKEGVGVIDVASGQHHVQAIGEGVRRLAWGPDGLFAGTSSGEIWTMGATPARLVEAIDEEISGLAVASNGTIAACGGDPFSVATFGRHGNEEWRAEPSKWPYCVRLSDDGALLAMATWDGRLFVLDACELPDEIDDVEEYAGGPIFDAQFLPGGDAVVAGARFVRVWDRASGAYTHHRELAAEALAIAVAPDGSCAVVSTNDQRLRLLGLPELDELGELAVVSGAAEPRGAFPDYAEFCRVRGGATVRALAFHPDGARVFASTDDGRLIEVTRAELERHAPPKMAAPARVVDAAMVEAAMVEAPIVEAPIVEAPIVEVPIVEALVVEAPIVEALVVEAPVVKAPVVKAPVVKAPRRDAARPRKKPAARRSSAKKPTNGTRAAAKKPTNGTRAAAKKATKPAAKSASRPLARRVAGTRKASKKSQPRR